MTSGVQENITNCANKRILKITFLMINYFEIIQAKVLLDFYRPLESCNPIGVFREVERSNKNRKPTSQASF